MKPTTQPLGPHWRLATIHERMPDEFGMQLLGLLNHVDIAPDRITGVAIASGVPPLTSKWADVCRTYLSCDPMIVSANMKTGMPILYDNPASVGADRIVDAVAGL